MGALETIISARYGFRDSQRSRKWESYLFLAAPPTSGLQPSEPCQIVRNDDAKRFCYTQWSAADERPHDEAGHAKAADHMRKP
jgi:hypothetical protein